MNLAIHPRAHLACEPWAIWTLKSTSENKAFGPMEESEEQLPFLCTRLPQCNEFCCEKERGTFLILAFIFMIWNIHIFPTSESSISPTPRKYFAITGGKANKKSRSPPLLPPRVLCLIRYMSPCLTFCKLLPRSPSGHEAMLSMTKAP